MAVAEERGLEGTELLLGIICGYEVMTRVSLGGSMELVSRGFRSNPIFGTVGAAAAAGKLMGLNAARLATAIGYGANLASGFNEGWWSGTMETMFHAGSAARNGVFAARIAEAGGTVSAHVLEGRHGFYQAFCGTAEHVGQVTAGLGETWGIMRATWKPYAACALNQVPIDLALTLRAEAGFDPSRITRVIERVNAFARQYPGSDVAPPYHSMFQAQMSAQFCLAAALLGRPVADPMFYAQHFDDAEVWSLAKRVELVGEVDRQHPAIEVYMADGHVLRIDEDRAERLQPNAAETAAKFRRLTAAVLDAARQDQIIEAVQRLDRPGVFKQLCNQLGNALE